MKILAIRGENLASLEGPFALELAEGPLARAGVFAICGPTGAGKSTVLDAMCLALFDTAPRLASSSRVRVGREDEVEAERLTTSDPRSILRKGAGHGFAEVDFLGVDGRRYRARWEVRRARGRAGARLQAASTSLADLDAGAPVAAGRKTDVRQAIEERLGLTFDQFRRSVLLAQGDFAAFLDADSKERAGLLERMTGTEIYGVISMGAHARAGEERRTLEAIEERAGLVHVLDEAERAALEGELEGLAIRAREDALRALVAHDAVRWHAQLEGLRREEHAAREDHDHVVRQLALAEPQRHELEAFERAKPLRPELDESDRATARARALDVDRASARERCESARALAGEASREHAACARALDEAELALAETGPAIAHARVLARELERAGALARDAEARALQRRDALEARRRERASIDLAIEAHEREAAAAWTWLEAHPEAERLAARWDRNEARLDRLRELCVERATRAMEVESARALRDEAEARQAERAPAHAHAAAACAEAERAFCEAEAKALEAPSAALAPLRAGWTARRTALEAMINVRERAQRASEAEARQRAAAAHASVEADRARSEQRAAELEREEVEARLDEARRMRDVLRATLDLGARRAELREGEPCPLCGAEDHPFARQAPAVAGLLHAQDTRVDELAGSLSALDAGVAGARRAAESHDAARLAALEEASRWSLDLAQASRAWSAAARSEAGEHAARPLAIGRLTIGLLAIGGEADGPLLDAAAFEALVQARDAAIAALAELDAGERTRREREHEASAARSAFERARALAGEAEVAATRAMEALAAAEREHARHEREHAASCARLDALAAELGEVLGPFSGWRERLDDDARAFVDRVRAEAQAWLEQAGARAEALSSARDRAPSLESARAQEHAASEALHEAESVLARAHAELAERRAEREAVLAGVDPDALERALRDALDTARAGAREAQAALANAQRTTIEQEAHARQLEHALAVAQAEGARATERLHEALEAAGLAEDEARTRLARDSSEVEGWRRELERLDADRAHHAAVLAERTRKREAHEQNDAPSLDAAAAKDAMAAAERRSVETRELLMAARLRLEADDARHAEVAELAAALRAQRAQLAVWTALSELIGSATGAKLRVFAQSLTLELLLGHANHHLRELAPRYALARVPGEDLALMVIDHEMGDEVRSVGSLSGGESFVVALGMALGLASLGSQRAEVGSLFIDEGFGALDPASLDVVLSALDRLHAKGRQIGLISHVSAMAERFDTRVELVAAGPARSRVELVEGAA